jgi:lysophospholipase L1-like esterase
VVVKLAALASAAIVVLGGIALWLASPGLTASSAALVPVKHAPKSCIARLEGSGTKSVVIVGASFTAGVGSGSPDRSWAAILARAMHKNAVVYGIAGAGYLRSGARRQGPVAAEIRKLDLARLAPALVIVQAGHDDIGVTPGVVRQRVTQVIKLIRAEAPRALIALVTVFRGHASVRAARRTDNAIVAAATAADPRAIIMDPLAGHWEYQHAPDGLHPTAAGSEWLAAKAAAILRADGVLGPATGGGVSLDRAGAGASVLCEYSVSSSPRRPSSKPGLPITGQLASPRRLPPPGQPRRCHNHGVLCP